MTGDYDGLDVVEVKRRLRREAESSTMTRIASPRRSPRAQPTRSHRSPSGGSREGGAGTRGRNGRSNNRQLGLHEDAVYDGGSSDDDLQLQRLEHNMMHNSSGSIGSRSQSTVIRLQSQGFRGPSRRESYAVQHIEKGSLEWRDMLKPFVSDLVLRSIVDRNIGSSHQALTFKPYTCQAAVMFVDLSGYSKITSAIAHKGAHVLSDTVNAYLSRLLRIIREYAGDIVKFAGDAILCVWEGDEQELEINVLVASKCALELQQSAGEHAVEGTDLKFTIHIGLCCGPLDSEVYEAPSTTQNMQSLYHYVGGDSMTEIGDLVDFAKSGEICVSANYKNILESGTFRMVDSEHGRQLRAQILISPTVTNDPQLISLMDWMVNRRVAEMNDRRLLFADLGVEDLFVHKSVLDHLSHGGLQPTQIAQMRTLCVLFVAMTSQGSSTNWLTEVQAILDRNRCPIVQIIHDDKGVHITAAVCLYEAVPEACMVGLEICRELQNKRVGAAVGMAVGSTFCGVTGSADACRWDITGAPVVRAARLMQYAQAHKTEFAIDESVYDDHPMAAARMQILDPSVDLKGTKRPIKVYTLSTAKLFCAFRILDNVHGSVHNTEVQAIHNHISGRKRSAVLVTGIPLSGMLIASQRAAGFTGLTPYLHVCEDENTSSYMQLGRSIATWFSYMDDEEIKGLAEDVMSDLKSNCWSCAHDQCVNLVNAAMKKNMRACFVLQKTQLLDRFSLSLIRECLLEPPKSRGKNTEDFGGAQICFLMNHSQMYGARPAQDLVDDITRSHSSFRIPIVEVGEARKDDLQSLIKDLYDIDVEDRWLECYAEASGHCAEYYLQRVEAVKKMSAVAWQDGSSSLVATSEDLVLYIPPGLVRKNRNLKVTTVSPETAMRFSQVYDDIPPMCQLIIKFVTIATHRGFFKLSFKLLWETMNDYLQQGIDLDMCRTHVENLSDVRILKIEESDEYNDRLVSIQSPALADIVMDVCTPVQIRVIASKLSDRLACFEEGGFEISLVLASLQRLIASDESTDINKVKQLFVVAYAGIRQARRNWGEAKARKWLEIIDDEIQESGLKAEDVLGSTFSVDIIHRSRIAPNVAMLKTYCAPVSLGIFGLTLNVICRNLYLEYGCFNGCGGIERLRESTQLACNRYIAEKGVIESFLSDVGQGQSDADAEQEYGMITHLASPSEDPESLGTKAFFLWDDIIPLFVGRRLRRLYNMVWTLKGGPIPDVFHGKTALRRAYEALQKEGRNRPDAAQDALMILATMNWKPPGHFRESLPLVQHLTVANIRNAVLRRLDDADKVMLRHQQSIDDLEAFLIVSAVLEQGRENGLC